MDRLREGDDAPSFELPSEEGPQSLDAHRGEWVVLYFYPRDFTSGCTQEACDFRDALANRNMNATVLGVSPDDVESHRRFKEEHQLPFTLLADEDHRVAEAYGAYGEKTVFGKKGTGIIRSTFLIDPEGKIRKTYYDVRSSGHASQVAEDLARLQA